MIFRMLLPHVQNAFGFDAECILVCRAITCKLPCVLLGVLDCLSHAICAYSDLVMIQMWTDFLYCMPIYVLFFACASAHSCLNSFSVPECVCVRVWLKRSWAAGKPGQQSHFRQQQRRQRQQQHVDNTNLFVHNAICLGRVSSPVFSI